MTTAEVKKAHKILDLSNVNLQHITVALANHSESLGTEQIADMTLAGHNYGLYNKAFFTEEAITLKVV